MYKPFSWCRRLVRNEADNLLLTSRSDRPVPVAFEQYVNANYSAYHHDTMCNNVCLFAPDGKVKYTCLNFTGYWHDSMVCQSLIIVVLLHIGMYKICVHQGFPRGGELFDKFVGPISIKSRQNYSPILRRT